MRRLFVNLCLLACFSAATTQAEIPFEDGVTPAQLAQITKLLGPAPLVNIRLFREKKNARISVAVLSVSRGAGWQIRLISPDGLTGYKASWISSKLPASFDVSSPANLSGHFLKDEDAIVFSGCAPHMCPEIFSVLLYVPSLHRAFVGTCRDSHMTYSFTDSHDSMNEYKEALKAELQEIDRHGGNHACSSETEGKK